MKTLSSQHTCASMGLVGGEVVLANQQSWLRRVVPTHLFITKSTKAQEIINCIQMHYAQTTSYQAARKVKVFLIDDRQEYQQQQFKYIPQYVTSLVQEPHDLYIQLDFESSSVASAPQIFQ